MPRRNERTLGRLIPLLTSLTIFLAKSVSSQVWGESITVEINETTSIDYTRYSTPMSWFDANDKCRQHEQQLLCFEGLTPLLRTMMKDTLGIWLSSRTCSNNIVEHCLSLSVSNLGSSLQWKFHFACDKPRIFVCMKIRTKTSGNLVSNDDQATEDVVSPPGHVALKTCSKTFRRGIDWPASPGNTNSSIKCPENMRGYAKWYCNGTTGEWGPGQPNLSSCRSVALSNVLNKVREHADNPPVTYYTYSMSTIDLTQTAKDLRQMVSNLQTGGDIKTAVEILDRVEDVFVSQAPAMTPAQRKQSALDISEHVINVCDELLGKADAWNDLALEARYATATTFLTAVDETGNVLASTIETEKHKIVTKNVAIEVRKTDSKAGGSRNMTYEDNRIWSHNRKNSMSLMASSDLKQVVFAIFSDLRDILPPHDDHNGSPKKVINSPVIGANISGQFHGKVRVHLSHLNNTSLGNTTCAYWNVVRQRWSADGCKLVESGRDFTVCECDHLTNFAILVDVSCPGCKLSLQDKLALAVITIIGCSVSIFCLSVCIVIFSIYRSLWGMRVMIHRNLCICLLIAQIIFLGGVDRTENKIVCAGIAGILHYFFLAAFFWMFLEAFHIFWLLIKVFNPKQSHGIKFYLCGYGCPALILAVTAGVRPQGYGTTQYCWLNAADGTIWGFAGPILVIILFNAMSLAYALYTTQRIVIKKDKPQAEGFQMWVRGAAVLMPLLGVTWIIGFLYVDNGSVIFAYFFAALNSLQGLGIFLFHCLLNKKVKEHVWRSFERSSFRRSGIGSGSSRTPSSRGTSVKNSASPKRRNTSKFFVSADPAKPVPDEEASSPTTPREEEGTEEEQRTAMLKDEQAEFDKRNRLNTNELYPLEVEK